LAEALSTFRPKYDLFSNQQNSELYLAIEEGIARLEKEPSDRVRAIVVFTAGSNLDNYGGRNSIDESRAVSLKIPVYAVKYPIRGCEHCTNVDLISQKTYGQQIATADILIAADLLRQCYNGMSARHHGQDYRIAFTSPFSHDGKQHSITLTVGGKEYPISFTAPTLSFKMWIKENLFWTILISISLLIIIALTAFLIVRAVKKYRRKLIELEIKQQAAAEKAANDRKEFEQYRQQKADEETLAEKHEKEKKFVELMQVKNLLPRLQYESSGEKTTFRIVKPETTIGRDENNDLVLLNDSVSRRHAKVVFNGGAFEIQDLGSSNKVIVNGVFIERTTLKNGDIIGLGEVVIYFSL
jgi:cell division protein FtsL